MFKNILFGGLVAVGLFGCSSPAGSGGASASLSPASFKGAKVRVLNLSADSADASLNDQSYGESLAAESASSFKLSAFKKPVKVSVSSASGSHEYMVPLKGSTAFTLVYTGSKEPTIIIGEPTEIAGGSSILYFHSLLEGASTPKLAVKPGIGNGVEVAHSESKVVAPGSFEASVELAGGKTANFTLDLVAGDAVSLLLVGTSSAPKLLMLRNNTQMIITGAGGASAVG
jgi:hypothetical protein